MWFAMSFKVFLSQKFSRNFPTVNSYCVVRSGKNISIVNIFVIRQPLLQQLSYIPNILQDFLKISFGWYTQLLSWVRYPKESIGFFRSECNGTNRVQCPSSRNTNGTRLAVLLTCLDATSLLWLEKNLVMGRVGYPKLRYKMEVSWLDWK